VDKTRIYVKKSWEQVILTKYVIKHEYANIENWEIKGLEYLNQLAFGI